MTDPHPQHPRPIIRLFVSATFSDLKHERNALEANVRPALERSCRRRDFSFPAIDLCRGVPTKAGLDHRTLRIGFAELRPHGELAFRVFVMAGYNDPSEPVRCKTRFRKAGSFRHEDGPR